MPTTEMTPTADGFAAKDPGPGGPTPNPPQRDPMLQFFAFSHLPVPLQATSREFYVLANWIDQNLPRNPERTVALRKLLEAKDCAVRAQLFR